MKTRYINGSLAEKYDDIDYTEETTPSYRQERDYRDVRCYVYLFFSIVVIFYFVSVVTGMSLVQYNNRLVDLKQYEKTLVDSNQNLQVEVDKLKNPARITHIAETRLGLRRPSGNVYMAKVGKKKIFSGLARAGK